MSSKVAVFGGSFNPPTYAHLSVIEGVKSLFDKVIVMPTATSPFKIGAEIIPDEVRLDMLRNLTAHIKNIEISSYEMTCDGVSYTYLTLQYLSETYENLYFILGTDNIDELYRWKNLGVIGSLCTLYFVPRPYYEVTKEQIDKLNALKLKYEFAPFTGEEGSSSLLKAAVAFGKESEVAPPIVADYIRENNLFPDYKYITAAYEKFNLKPHRAEHIYRTAKAALILAKKNGVSAEKAVRAALMHDIGKYITTLDLRKTGVILDSEAYEAAPPVQHCYTGEYIARAYLNEIDADVLNAIKYHTTGRAGMSALEKVIFVADYIEEGREIPNIEEIRSLCFRDLDAGMKVILDATLAYLKSKGATIDQNTIKCRNWLKGENKC